MSAAGAAVHEYACCCGIDVPPPPRPGPLDICYTFQGGSSPPPSGPFQTQAGSVLSCAVSGARHVTQGIWLDRQIGLTWQIQANLIPPGTTINIPNILGLAQVLEPPLPGQVQGISWNSPVFTSTQFPIYTSPLVLISGQNRIVRFWIYQVTINEIHPEGAFGCPSYTGPFGPWSFGGTGIRFKIGVDVVPHVAGVYISAYDSAPGIPVGGPSFPNGGGYTFNIDMFRCCEARVFHSSDTPPSQLALLPNYTGIEGPYTYTSCGFGQPVVTEYAYNFSGAFIPDAVLPCSSPQANPPATYPPRGKYWMNTLWVPSQSPPGTPVPTTVPLNYAVVS